MKKPAEECADLEEYARQWYAEKQARLASGGCPILLAVELLSLSCALPEIELPGVDMRTVGGRRP